MNELEFNLNALYKKLYMQAESFMFGLNDRFYKSEIKLLMGSLMHYENEEYDEIFYPIPVVQVGRLCDVEFWLDKIIITARITLRDLKMFDLSKLQNYEYEFYGCREYPYLFYKKADTNFKEKLDELYKLYEKEIGIQIYFSQEESKDIIIKCVDFLRKQEVFYYKKGRD